MGKLVGTSSTGTTDWATRWPSQRKSFYAAGRFWVFYSDGTNMVYCTSTDGMNWTDPTTVRACLHGNEFSIWFDGTYLHYAYAPFTVGGSLMYRRGTPNSDGTITWSTGAEQTAVAGVGGTQYASPFVSVDSDGSAWIGYIIAIYPNYQAYVTKSSTTTGTWATDGGAGFPFSLSTSTVRALNISIILLTGGKMLAVYARGDIRVNARLWNGAAWGAEISTINAIDIYYNFSAVAGGDIGHLVFSNLDHSLTYAKYDYASNSFVAEKLLIGMSFLSAPVISIDKNNNLLVFWGGYPEANTLYYLKYTAENDTWGPAVKWKSEENLNIWSLTCFYKQNSGYTGLVYTTNTSSPYDVKFNYVAPPPPPGVEPEPGEPGSPGAPEPTAEPEVESNTLTSGGSRHATPEEGSVGTALSVKRTRITRHITWVPVVITRA